MRQRKIFRLLLLLIIMCSFSVLADGPAKYRPWIANGKDRIAKTPYWLLEFKKTDAFSKRSKELADKIVNVKGASSAPMCIAFFENINGIKQKAILVCGMRFTSDGYDEVCKSLSVNLGTGEGKEGDILAAPDANGNIIADEYGKCTKNTLAHLIGGFVSSSALGYIAQQKTSDVGIYVYRDTEDAVQTWLDTWERVQEKTPRMNNKKEFITAFWRF